MLEKEILEQVRGVFADLQSQFVLRTLIDAKHEKAEEMRAFLTDFSSCSDHIDVAFEAGEEGQLQFKIHKNGEPTGVIFRGIPGGHEFTSLLLAILNADGKGKNLPDEAIAERIRRIDTVHIRTYVSLSCTNCPDVVQALNVMAILNKGIVHEVIDGALWQQEVDNLHIQGVPAVFIEGKLLHSGRSDMGELLQKLEAKYAEEEPIKVNTEPQKFDVLVIGGGPAGASAAIYSARKKQRVAVIAGRMGGHVNDTMAIENLINVRETTGRQLANDFKENMASYGATLFEHRMISEVDFSGEEKIVRTASGETFSAPAVIIATGAKWRRLGVEGEEEHVGHGVAFCPHCDGPLFKGRHVAVVGGGNSGMEAAIDLSGICSKVTVLEFLDTLRADTVLQERVKSLPNVEVFTGKQTTRIVGDGSKVTAIEVKDRATGNVSTLKVDGVFVQIGLMPASEPFVGALKMTQRGEIEIDSLCRTSVPGVYAAGDVSSVVYKQIAISIGEGAKAALTAFNDKIWKKAEKGENRAS